MQLILPKGWVFPPCYLDGNGSLDVNAEEGTYDINNVHSAVWYLVKEGDDIQTLIP